MDEPVEITILNPGGGRELIMFVDDDPLAVELAREILQYHDYRVVVASNGLEALHIYKKLGSQIALVILDLFMPLVDGDAVFDELKALNPDVRVVLSSGCCGFTEQGKIRHMLQQGLCGFIPKPYTEKKLIDQVRTTLAA